MGKVLRLPDGADDATAPLDGRFETHIALEKAATHADGGGEDLERRLIRINDDGAADPAVLQREPRAGTASDHLRDGGD